MKRIVRFLADNVEDMMVVLSLPIIPIMAGICALFVGLMHVISLIFLLLFAMHIFTAISATGKILRSLFHAIEWEWLHEKHNS